MTPGASGTAAVNGPRHVPGPALAKTKEVRKDPSYPQLRPFNQAAIGGSVLLEKPGSIMGGKQQRGALAGGDVDPPAHDC